MIKDEENLFLNWITEITNGKFKIISSKEKLNLIYKIKWSGWEFTSFLKLKNNNNLRYKQKMLINHKK